MKNPCDEIEGPLDLIPSEVLSLIVSRLPTTEEAVRTSIVCPEWRYLWTQNPVIDIDISRGGIPKMFQKKEFKEFVYWVLLNTAPSRSLESFRLSCSDHYNMSTIGRWIHHAVMKNVKVIHLKFSARDKDYEDIQLPHCLVTSRSLEVLRLFLCFSPLDLPESTKFEKLRVLELNGVELMYQESVEKFFKSCESLEELVLVDLLLSRLEYLEISCPNLKRLTIDNRKLVEYEYPVGHDIDDYSSGSSFKKHYRPGYKRYYKGGLCETLIVHCPKLVFFEFGGEVAIQFNFELESLKEAVIYPEDMLLGHIESATVCELFAAISHVESLSINYYFLQCINKRRDVPATLSNLKTLQLRTLIDEISMSQLIHLLKCSPSLECLHLIIEEVVTPPEYHILIRSINDDKISAILTRHLKRVEFLEFNGEEQMLGVAKFLLEHGNALEEMVISWRDGAKTDEQLMKTMTELSKFTRDSSVEFHSS